jgi:hypothetical protein
MPRKTSLSIVGERMAPDMAAIEEADYRLQAAVEDAHPLVPPADIVEALRRQVADNARVASQAIDQANQERARAEMLSAEIATAKAEVEEERKRGFAEITAVRGQAAAAVAAVQLHEKQTLQAADVATKIHAATQRVGQLFGFAIDRAPVLLTLAGAFALARTMLPQPDIYQLALLGIYGGVAVLPAVWLSIRRSA